MAGDAEGAEGEGEAVHEEEEEVQRDDGVDAAGEEASRGDGVFFDELGEVVEPACWGVLAGGGRSGTGDGTGEGRDTDCEGEERETEEEAEVAD